jgi:purine-binding chemotaxis protein CheW
VIKDQSGLGLVMVLDAARLVEQEFQALAHGRAEGSMLAAGLAHRPGRPPPPAMTRKIQLVSFEVAGQEYALPIHSVREIVQLPETVTRVPKAPGSVMGVIALRDRLLPVVSCATCSAWPPGKWPITRVAVVSVGPRGCWWAWCWTRSTKCCACAAAASMPCPPMLAANGDLAEITAICRLDGGKRLVSILSAEAMFDPAAIEKALKDAGGDMTMTADQARSRGASADRGEEQFVVFRLMDEEFGVDIATVQEIVRVPEDLARVPRTDDHIRGVMNLRGAVIPLIDQRARFNLPPCEDNDRQRIVVFTHHGVQTGFIVDSVSEVMRIAGEHIKPAPDMSDQQRRVIRRVANLPQQRRMILLLDAAQMLDRAPARWPRASVLAPRMTDEGPGS